MVFTWSALVIAPTAMVAMPASLRICSENSVWYIRPYTGVEAGSVWPVDTSIRSQPCALNVLPISTASAALKPPGIQSVAEMRTAIGRSAGHAARTASNSSSGKRSRFASDPPYASVRRLVTGEMKLASR